MESTVDNYEERIKHYIYMDLLHVYICMYYNDVLLYYYHTTLSLYYAYISYEGCKRRGTVYLENILKVCWHR